MSGTLILAVELNSEYLFEIVIAIAIEIVLANVCGYERDARTSVRIKFGISF
jgi:hypothetical protein